MAVLLLRVSNFPYKLYNTNLSLSLDVKEKAGKSSRFKLSATKNYKLKGGRVIQECI